MRPKRQSVIQHVLVLLIAFAMPHMASANDPYQPYTLESPPQSDDGLDGEWVTEIPFTPPDAWGWGFRISGDIGILTMSYSPNTTKTKVGEVKLRISTKTSTAFRGYLICADGNPYPVNGVLLQDGRLGMQVSGGCRPTNWTMVRNQIAENRYSQPRMHITALALGKTWKDRPLFISVPDHADIEVEVSFSIATSSPFIADHVDYIWRIDGLNEVRGQTFKYKFKPGTYDVMVFPVNKDFPYQTTTLAMNPPPNSTHVEVNIMRNERWACRGRIGKKCGGYEEKYIVNLKSTLKYGCDGKYPNKICIDSMASVGAIKHDICCDKNRDGYMCDGLPSMIEGNLTGTDDCIDDWGQAMIDWNLRKSFQYQQLNTFYSWTWTYPSDKPFIDDPGWSVGMVPPQNIIVGYNGEGYNGFKYKIEDAIHCSGQVKEAQVNRPYPIFTFLDKTLEIRNIYFCTETNVIKENTAKQVAPKSNSEAKKDVHAECNNESSVPAIGIGGAQGALKKFGTGTGGCVQ